MQKSAFECVAVLDYPAKPRNSTVTVFIDYILHPYLRNYWTVDEGGYL